MEARAYVRQVLVLLLVALAFAVARRADAQVVRGQVVAVEDGRPLRGVLFTLIDSLGASKAASLSDSLGRFRMQAPAPGTYRLRGEIVGRYVDLTDPFFLDVGPDKVIPRVASFTRTHTLASVRINSASSCAETPDAEHVAGLWLEVTKALRNSEWSVNDERLVFDIEVTKRSWDAKRRTLLDEQRGFKEGVKGRPFITMPPDWLAENGYVVVRDYDNLYFAPDEKSLLHESFLSHHCFALAPPRPGLESLIGIAFSRAPDRDRPDVAGVFWLNRDSLLLRAVDYKYSGLAEFEMHPSLGGRMEFDRLPTGEWYISRWRILMPVIGICRRGGFLGFGSREAVPCLDGIDEAAGEVLDVRRQGIPPPRR